MNKQFIPSLGNSGLNPADLGRIPGSELTPFLQYSPHFPFSASQFQ